MNVVNGTVVEDSIAVENKMLEPSGFDGDTFVYAGQYT